MADKKKVVKKDEEINYTSTKQYADNFDDYKPTWYVVPSGVHRWRPKELGTAKLDFMPHRVGKGNPKADEGQVHWDMVAFIHKKVGPAGKDYLCLRENFGEDCPCCEHVSKLRRDGRPEKELKELEPKTKRLFLVIDRKDKEKGIQIMEASHYKSFGQLINEEIQNADEDSPWQKFWHLRGGSTLLCRVVEDSWEQGKFKKISKIERIDRQGDYGVEMLKKAPCLEDCVRQAKLSYEDLEAILYAKKGGDEDEQDETEEQEEKPKNSTKKPAGKKPKPAEDEETEDVEEVDDDDSEESADETEDSDSEEDEETSDDDESGDDDGESESEDSGDDDEESDDESAEPAEPDLTKGDMVEWEGAHKGQEPGKFLKTDKGLAHIKDAKGKLILVPIDNVSKVVEEEEEVEEVEEEEIEEQSDDSDGEEAEEEEADTFEDLDDDDSPFPEEDEEEEEEKPKPAPKKSGKPQPGKPAPGKKPGKK